MRKSGKQRFRIASISTDEVCSDVDGKGPPSSSPLPVWMRTKPRLPQSSQWLPAVIERHATWPKGLSMYSVPWGLTTDRCPMALGMR